MDAVLALSNGMCSEYNPCEHRLFISVCMINVWIYQYSNSMTTAILPQMHASSQLMLIGFLSTGYQQPIGNPWHVCGSIQLGGHTNSKVTSSNVMALFQHLSEKKETAVKLVTSSGLNDACILVWTSKHGVRSWLGTKPDQPKQWWIIVHFTAGKKRLVNFEQDTKMNLKKNEFENEALSPWCWPQCINRL